MHHKIDRHLHSEEKVLFIGKPSWLKYRHELMLSMFILPLIFAGLKKYTTNLIITNRRIISLHGIIGEHSKATTFHNLTTVKVHQSAIGRIFNYGHLYIHTQTGGHADMAFQFIKNPISIKKEIEKRIK